MGGGSAVAVVVSSYESGRLLKRGREIRKVNGPLSTMRLNGDEVGEEWMDGYVIPYLLLLRSMYTTFGVFGCWSVGPPDQSGRNCRGPQLGVIPRFTLT